MQTNIYVLLSVKNTDSVKVIKSMARAKCGYPTIRLNFASRWLKSQDILVDCKIQSNSSIWVFDTTRKIKTTL